MHFFFLPSFVGIEQKLNSSSSYKNGGSNIGGSSIFEDADSGGE